ITCNGDGTYNVTLHNHSLTYNAGSVGPLEFTYSGPGVPTGASGDSVTLTGVLPGTYTYTMYVNGAPSSGTPECEVSVTVTLDPEPDPNFTTPADGEEFCSDEPITLSIPGGYVAGNTYEWSFNVTSFYASETDTEIQLPGGDYPITLTVTTPYGCTYKSTNNVEVIINEADFDEGTIDPDDGDFCDNSSVIPLSYDEPFGTIPPTDIIWMKGNVQVGTGMTYQPTESGSYWPVLIDA